MPKINDIIFPSRWVRLRTYEWTLNMEKLFEKVEYSHNSILIFSNTHDYDKCSNFKHTIARSRTHTDAHNYMKRVTPI